MFLLVSVRHVGAHPGEHQHGVSLQISISLGKTFLRISRIRNIPLTWILARVFFYVPPFISRILDFIYWTVLIFILIYFDWRDTENQQTGERNNRFFLTRKCMAVLPGGQNKVAVITRRLYFTEVAVRRGFTELKSKSSPNEHPLKSSQNPVFLTSLAIAEFSNSRIKRPVSVTNTFFASRGCPLTRASTVSNNQL